MVDKKRIIKELCLRLKRELNTHFSAAQEAKEAATHEESKAENKYDTRGLEASYLAAGQARRAEEVGQIIRLLESATPKSYGPTSPLGVFALVQVEVENLGHRLFFLVPKQGGEKVQIDQHEITSLSIESPLGESFLGKQQGDAFEFTSQGQEREYEITQVW